MSGADELIARLRRNPDDAQAFAALRAHYHHAGDAASLANLLEGWAGRAPDAQQASQAFFEAGEYALSLGDVPRAAALDEKALARWPGHEAAFARLESLYAEAGDLRRVVDLLERQADALARLGADARHLATLHLRTGEVWEQQLQRADRAITHYRRAFELDATLVAAIYAAREIYRNAGNAKAAAQLYDLEVQAEPDAGRKVALLREAAHLRTEQLGDLNGALKVLERALTLAPGDTGVLHDFATRLLARAEKAGETDEGRRDRQKAADLLFQLAQAFSLGQDPEQALSYGEAALDAAPDHEEALQLVERTAEELGREQSLPLRWVQFLTAAPDAPGANARRSKLGRAYLEAGQLDDAIVCFEPLAAAGDAQAAEALVGLYERSGRPQDAVRVSGLALSAMPPERRVPKLRALVQQLAAQGDRENAVLHARMILDVDPSDPEALNFLEDEFRRRGAWGELRDLALSAARVPGLSVESRKTRLREVAQLSEAKLADHDGAIGAWRAISSLDPADGEARGALRRLLEKHHRWDELVQVLERDALSTTDPDARIETLRRLGQVHHVERRDPGEAIGAYRQILELRSRDVAAREALCDALVETDQFAEAVPLLRERIDVAKRGPERGRLLRILASGFEAQLGDAQAAFDAWARLLDDEPGDAAALDRMEAIDAGTGRWDRLLQTLSYRADVAKQPVDRARLLTRMGGIADAQLGDLEQAAEYYAQSLDLVPAGLPLEGAEGTPPPTTLDALCDVYDRAGRYRDLVELLRRRAEHEAVPTHRAELFRRIARILEARVRNDDAASEAWLEVLRAGEDEEALRRLTALADTRNDLEHVASYLDRLAQVVPSDEERRDLLVRRADLLVEKLAQPAVAQGVLRDVLDRVDAQHMPAIVRLVLLSETLDDAPSLADALERQLRATEDPGLRVPIAQRLADLYEGRLADASRAVAALTAWSESDLGDEAPHVRLVRLLEPLGRWKELVASLDALGELEPDDDAQSALVLRAAELARTKLNDVDGAWKRLAPRVREGDAKAEAALRTLAKETRRGEQLADLYVQLAQAPGGSAEAHARRWSDAAGVYETYVADVSRALEAVLRALALDLAEPRYLDEADRLAGKAKAWPRLAQVYDNLLKRGDDAQKVKLLLRHAALLDERAQDPSAALDRALRACSLAPDDDAVLAVVEALAPRAGRSEDLLVVYERRKAAAKQDARRIDALLRATRVAADQLGDGERAMLYVAQAVALTVRTPELGDAVEDVVRAMDATEAKDKKRGASDGARRTLVDIYVRIAEEMAEPGRGGGAKEDAAGGARLLVRASKILEAELRDEGRAYQVLASGAALAPSSVAMIDALEEFSTRTKRLNAYEQTLAHLAEEALDSKTAALLLQRRATVLETVLGKPGDAAEVYQRLVQIAPQDLVAKGRLRMCLRAAGRHQDLLVAIDRELEKTKDPSHRLALLKESASTWEGAIKNRFEALDLWKKIQKLSPDDPDAGRALARLEQASRRPTIDDADLLADDDVAASNKVSLEAKYGAENDQPATFIAPIAEAPAPPPPPPPEPAIVQAVSVTAEITNPALEALPDDEEDEELARPTTPPAPVARSVPPPPPVAAQSAELADVEDVSDAEVEDVQDDEVSDEVSDEVDDEPYEDDAETVVAEEEALAPEPSVAMPPLLRTAPRQEPAAPPLPPREELEELEELDEVDELPSPKSSIPPPPPPTRPAVPNPPASLPPIPPRRR